MNDKLVEKCSEALRYYDRLNLEYEIERLYKIEKGYNKMGLNWAFTHEDRRIMESRKDEAIEWVLLLHAISIIAEEIKNMELPEDPTNTRRCFVVRGELHAFTTGYFAAKQDMLKAILDLLGMPSGK